VVRGLVRFRGRVALGGCGGGDLLGVGGCLLSESCLGLGDLSWPCPSLGDVTVPSGWRSSVSTSAGGFAGLLLFSGEGPSASARHRFFCSPVKGRFGATPGTCLGGKSATPGTCPDRHSRDVSSTPLRGGFPSDEWVSLPARGEAHERSRRPHLVALRVVGHRPAPAQAASSLSGLLIHAATGIGGGVGARRTNRSRAAA